jgi:tRNA nucleotidyltransferase (CCA-adding enzyme)
MEAGTVEVHLNDSIQHLQKVMMDSGWGQVPVVDVDTHKVIGIVTRTDVLKMLSRRQPHSAQYQSLAGKLTKMLPPELEKLIRTVAEEAASLHLPVYVVGGFVRDLLLGQPGADLDVVVEGDAISLGNDLVSKFGGKLTTHTRFGTAKWYLDSSSLASAALPLFLDLISARQEFYEHPSALPTVEHSSIKLDLHRRDFTINTLAMRLDGRHYGELHDYYGGFSDIERRYVRVLHSLSFVDDPTRMLRAVRYEQRYGFEIEARTLQLMAEARPLIARLSEERVRHELDLILLEKKVVAMLARLEELALLKAIGLDLPWNPEVASRLETAIRNSVPSGWGLINAANGHAPIGTLLYSLWFLDLPSEAIDALQTRLGFSVAALAAIRAAASLYADLAAFSGANPSRWVDRLDGVPLLSVYAVYLASGEAALKTYATRWRNIHPQTTGETLMARGLMPGPSFRSLLTTLRKAWLDGKLATAADEAAYLDELLK